MSIMSFQHPIIKDLIWLIQTPGLLKSDNAFIPDQIWLEQQLQNIYPALKALDKNPQRLKTLEEDIKPVVGDYFEKLVSLWLDLAPNIQQLKQHQIVYEDIEKNGRKTNGRKTIGEFDFLFVDTSTKQSFHWEVSVKFYFQVFKDNKYDFLGPNANDSLSKMMDKKLNQQLRLSQNENAKNLLEEYPKPINPIGIIKGMLFYPSSGDWQNPESIPPEIANNHQKGWWCHSNTLFIPQNSSKSNWLILQKPFWLTVHSDKLDFPLNFNEITQYIQSHFEHSIRPLLLAEVVQNNNKTWQEVSRGFIVSEHWPNAK